MWDVVIIGGGPAGLSAALVLGRARRRVLVCDDHHPRNASTKAIHGYLTQDGISPSRFLDLAREQLKPYAVDFSDFHVDSVRVNDGIFEVHLNNDEIVQGRKIILATGVKDALPPFDGIEHFFGKSVFHCPYCDGWENKDKPIAVYGKGERGPSMALTMVQWNPDLTLCTNGEVVDPRYMPLLKKHSIRIREEQILRLEGEGDNLERIVFKTGLPLQVNALFFNDEKKPQSDFGEKLGCATGDNGDLSTSDMQKTRVKGVFVAGDAGDELKMVILAAAEGAKAAFAINSELMDEEIGRLPE